VKELELFQDVTIPVEKHEVENIGLVGDWVDFYRPQIIKFAIS